MTARYRAPAGDGGLLAHPPLAEIGSQLDANADRLTTSDVRLGGVPLAGFRKLAVAEVIEAARRYLAEAEPPSVGPGLRTWANPAGSETCRHVPDRLIVAGHQPEFFHPGVWVKNFVLAGQARRHGRTALNLIVDNDAVKATTVRVPVVAADPTDVRAETVPFDRAGTDCPYEEYRVADRGLVDSFPDRLAAVTRDWGYEPLAVPTWPALRAELDRGATLGEAVSRARRGWERRWGVTNLELPVSRLAGTRAFAGFVQAVLTDLVRFRDCYNAAIRAYREANHLRSRNHPAPELGAIRETLEAPFWAWRGCGRRERVFVRHSDAAGHAVLAGETRLFDLTTDPDKFQKRWERLAADGWKVRPRALTLTLFTRLGLADGFLHGIGGGKYDEVTDEIIHRYFRIEPPGYAVVSATVRLPLHRFPGTPEALHRAERLARDLDWNPQRFPEATERLPDLVFEKDRLIEDEPEGRANRRDWFRQLQRVTRDLRPAVADRHGSMARELDRVRAELAANEIVSSREYAWLLFPEAVLRNCFSRHL